MSTSPFEIGIFALSALTITGIALLLLSRPTCLRIGHALGIGDVRGKGARREGLLSSEFADLDDYEDGVDERGLDVGAGIPAVMRLQVHLHAQGCNEAHDFEEVDLETHGLRTVSDIKRTVSESCADTVDFDEVELADRMVVQCMDEESMLLVAL